MRKSISCLSCRRLEIVLKSVAGIWNDESGDQWKKRNFISLTSLNFISYDLREILIILFPIIVWFWCNFLLLEQYLLSDIVLTVFLRNPLIWEQFYFEYWNNWWYSYYRSRIFFFQYFLVISFSCQLFFFSPNLLHTVLPEILKEPFSSILKLFKLFGINLMKEQVNS